MKKSKLTVIAAILAIGSATADAQVKITDNSSTQQKTEVGNSDRIFTAVELSPKFPGGDAQLYKTIADSIRYPEKAIKENIQGRVTVQFVVEKDGSVGDVKILRGRNPELDKEAVRVIKSLPKFNPGMMNGSPVRCWYTLPITFHLKSTQL